MIKEKYSISGIYKISSIRFPKRFYIGSSKNISNRWKQHLALLKQRIHHCKKLQKHYNEYGKEDLYISLVVGCENNKESLLRLEQFFIDSMPTYFNMSMDVFSIPQFRQKYKPVIKKKKKKVFIKDKLKEKIKFEEETKRQLLELLKKQKHNEEMIKKYGEGTFDPLAYCVFIN